MSLRAVISVTVGCVSECCDQCHCGQVIVVGCVGECCELCC